MSLTNKQKQNILDLVYSRTPTGGLPPIALLPTAIRDLFAEHGLNEDNLFVRGEPVIISAEVVKNILWQRNSQQVDFGSIEAVRGIVSGPYQGSNTSHMWRMVITPYSPSPQRVHIGELRYPNS